ncbi:MAG: type II toxin-antitoxin system RelE/ParE family toxin [Candidatus Omnitrophica bacterium]|nr:type II toxin-antitoxin system RelE/ParE family toxin [Candidatus Omnitrophota bacterium]
MGLESFRNKASADLAAGLENKRTRNLLPTNLHRNAQVKIQILRAANSLDDLVNFPGLKLERLAGKRRNEFSIRINDQYRICFQWVDSDAHEVSIEDYH